MDTPELPPTMVRFHLLRAQDSKAHLERLRSLAKDLLPQVTEMQADRLLAIIDEEVTRANLHWLRTAVDEPGWALQRTSILHPGEPGEDVRAVAPSALPGTDLNPVNL